MRIRCSILLLFAALSVNAQRVQEEITVDVIEVPVHVTRRGTAVTGLTQDLFELYVNGKRHPIEYFDVIDGRRPEPEVSGAGRDGGAAQPLGRRSLTVLLFDTANTTHKYLARASEAAQKFVAAASSRETFAVARLQADGVQFLVPFTTDRVAVLRAVTTLRPSLAGDVLGIATLDAERGKTVSSAAPAALEGANSDGLDGMSEAIMARALPPNSEAGTSSHNAESSTAAAVGSTSAFRESVTNQIRADSELRAARHLSFLADRLGPIDGVKHVILFAEGGRRVADPRTAALMHERFHAAGVILDAVELDSMRVHGFVGAETRNEGSLLLSPTTQTLVDRSEPLYTLALATGGTVTKHGNINEGLRLLREIQGVTYVLGFKRPETGKAQNEITVKVKNQGFGTTVTYRRGFSNQAPAGTAEGLFLADVLMNDIPQRGLTLNLNVDPQKAAARVLVSVPGQELLAREVDGTQTDIDVFLYVFNERDLVAAWAYWRLNIDLEKGREFLASNSYEIQRLFALAPGRYSAKALLRFPNTDITGFQRADFEVVAR